MYRNQRLGWLTHQEASRADANSLGRTASASYSVYPFTLLRTAGLLLVSFQVLFLLIIASPLLWAMVVKPLLIILASPGSDVLRIKRDYEGQGRRVLTTTRRGTIWGSRSIPSYRRYDVVVARHDGQIRTFEIGVQFTLFSDPDLLEPDEKHRKIFFQGSAGYFGPES